MTVRGCSRVPSPPANIIASTPAIEFSHLKALSIVTQKITSAVEVIIVLLQILQFRRGLVKTIFSHAKRDRDEISDLLSLFAGV